MAINQEEGGVALLSIAEQVCWPLRSPSEALRKHERYCK